MTGRGVRSRATGGSSTTTSRIPCRTGTLFLSDTTWDDPTVTDLDTLLFGPTTLTFDDGGLFGNSFASIDTVGGSANAYLGSGTWAFNTSTGHNEEVVAAPASQGVHAVVQHGVGFNGDKFNVPFSTTLGALSVNPSAVTSNAAADGTGCVRRHGQVEPRAAGPEGRRVRSQPAAVVHRARGPGRSRPRPTRPRRAPR